MPDRLIIRRGVYRDSVTLMLVSRATSAVPGVRDVVVAMTTPLNLDLLGARGFDLGGAGDLTVNDLVIAIRADDAEAAERALATVEDGLSAGTADTPGAGRLPPPVSLRAATRRNAELSVALVSVPGQHATSEAAAALAAGLHVFCFSNGVSLEHEATLKDQARATGLLFMGPDCGTAIIDGVGLGFANAVRHGPVGIVGASGTGIQEVCCLLDVAEVGISHAIGVGGRDLNPRIGGSMFRRGIELLDGDPDTEVIVAISKPPDPKVAAEILKLAASVVTPVVVAFLGLGERPAAPAGVEYADGLEAAAARAAERAGVRFPTAPCADVRRGRGGAIRGLYSGGTLCTEAMSIVSATLGKVTSNIPLRPDWRLADLERIDGHAFIDFGADELTQGRPHPMIDPTLRLERLAYEVRDPAVTVILLDLVLGYGAHADPAAEFAPAIAHARSEREDLTVIVSLCGTDRDPQGLDRQRERLLDAGAVVTRSVARAARVAIGVATISEEPGARA